MNGPPVPPRFVPTLTEIVDAEPLPDAGAVETGTVSVPDSGPQAVVVQRILQRVDLILENRLQEAVSRLVLAHTQTLALHLREEIADVVHQCMVQAFEQEAVQAKQPEAGK